MLFSSLLCEHDKVNMMNTKLHKITQKKKQHLKHRVNRSFFFITVSIFYRILEHKQYLTVTDCLESRLCQGSDVLI